MNILVVDDSRIMRNIVKNTTLDFLGKETACYEAENGVVAWDLLNEKKIDLILLDWNMPLLNGLELTIKIRANAKLQNIPILMITSEAAKYNVIEAVKAGVTDYLVKPVTDRSLYAKLKKICEKIEF